MSWREKRFESDKRWRQIEASKKKGPARKGHNKNKPPAISRDDDWKELAYRNGYDT